MAVAQLFPSASGVVKRWLGGTRKYIPYSAPFADNTLSVGLSLRLLCPGYAGPCLRIRRSSDNAETDINFVNGEVDTTAVSKFIDNGSGYCVTLYGQSLSRNATQKTMELQPAINIISLGKMELLFAGTSSYLVTEGFTKNQPIFFSTSVKFSGTSSVRIIDGAASDADAGRAIIFTASGYYRAIAGGSSQAITEIGTTRKSIGVLFAGASSAKTTSSADSMMASVGPGNIARIRIGPSAPGDSVTRFTELAIPNFTPTSAERLDIVRNSAAYWGET